MRKIFAVLVALAVSVGLVIFGGASAQAVTWSYLGWTTDHDDVVCNGTLIGSVTGGVGWEVSSLNQIRVAAHPPGHGPGITISNFTHRDLYTEGNHQIYQDGGFAYYRTYPPPGADHWLSAVINNKTFPEASTSYVATNNATWSPFGPSSGGFHVDQDPYVDITGTIYGCPWTNIWQLSITNPYA